MSRHNLTNIVEDGLLTDGQVHLLTELAKEFASLNEMPTKLKRESARLLENSKQMVQILEPQS